jgi:hypothetical protein
LAGVNEAKAEWEPAAVILSEAKDTWGSNHTREIEYLTNP